MNGKEISISFTLLLIISLCYCANAAPKRLPNAPRAAEAQCSVRDVERFDCFPGVGASQQSCEKRGCCWTPPTRRTFVNEPYCYYPSGYGGYRYLNITNTRTGIEAYLTRTFTSPFPEDVLLLKMIVKFEDQQRLRIKIIDAENKRFESPFPEIKESSGPPYKTDYKVIIDKQKVGFQVIRKSDDTILFDAMDVGGFIYANQMLQISAKLPSNIIYGLGEHSTRLLQSTNWNRIVLWNSDLMPVWDLNLYGSHPMYLNMEPNGNAHGMFLVNSNAMDIVLQDAPAITFRPIGGIMDMYFLLGPSPADVVRQYAKTVGLPYMPPRWALGFQLCRWGYGSLDETRTVMQRTLDAGIPLDVQWNDLDYMEHNNDFTYDKDKFADLPKFVQELHDKGMHYVPLVDPGVSGSEPAGTYPPYDKGIEMDIFVKNSSDQVFIGKVWNYESTVYPDFSNPRTLDYWTDMLKTMHDMFEFDGAWIDMNEPSNFLSGSTTGCPESAVETPPYWPAVNGGQLNHKTLCMSAKHYGGEHYNLHNLYAISEAKMTNEAMTQIRGKRPLMITRASFLGIGHYTGHWSGDVLSSWEELRLSIPQMLTFSILGVPLMGADICGFNGNTTVALCQRWMQLGAFYPFSRNHNTIGAIDQDPVALGPDVAASSRKALLIRYSLMPYLYTLFYKAHMRGDTVARPLFIEFPNEPSTYEIDDQFLWGDSLLICPVVEEDKTSRWLYLPSARWYNWYTLTEQSRGNNGWIEVDAPLDTIPLYVRGGTILAMQEPANNTYLQRNNKIQILAAADGNGTAIGELYWDDGESLDSIWEGHSINPLFVMEPGFLYASIPSYVSKAAEYELHLGRVTVIGLEDRVISVTVNDKEAPFKYDDEIHVLIVDDLDLPFNELVEIRWK